VFEGATITYGEMAARSAALAAGLQARGVDRGDVVALLAYNCPELLEALFAANHLGAIAMPINWRLAAPEVRYILEHSDARAREIQGVQRLRPVDGEQGGPAPSVAGTAESDIDSILGSSSSVFARQLPFETAVRRSTSPWIYGLASVLPSDSFPAGVNR
jgi:non-ribosomal peptide synthetase component F